ncbi:unnamed protein product, partial [marine sediment metagenome]
MQKDADIEEKRVGEGSFVISAGSVIEDAWKKLLADLTVEPIFIDNKPATAKKISMPRIALVETSFHDMDAGWTRFVFDTYKIPFKVVKPGDFSKTDFASSYDVVIFPSSSKSILMSGKYGSAGSYYVSSYAPQFTKGIGAEGMKKMMAFVDAGGTTISWGSSTALFEGTLSILDEKTRSR